MFRKITLHNFKGFRDFEIDFSELRTTKKAKNLIIIYGENGIGKSSVVDAFALLNKTTSTLTDLNYYTKEFTGKISEEQLSQDIIYFIQSKLKYIKIPGFIKPYIYVGSLENEYMSVCYDGLLKNNGKEFQYEMHFNAQGIISEKLLIENEIIFEKKENETVEACFISPKHFLADKFNQILHSYLEMYYGEHTFIGCLFYAMDNVTPDFKKKAFSLALDSFLHILCGLDVYRSSESADIEGHSYLESEKLLPHIANGVYEDSYEERKNNTKQALDLFFCSLYTKIAGVDYDIKEKKDGSKDYSLVFLNKTEGGITRVPYYWESTGTQKLLALFTYFYNVANQKDINVIDEIDSGINDIALAKLLSSFAGKIQGQLIITTHNTLLLKDTPKKCCYILNRSEENNHIEAYSLARYGRKIQENSNVIKQYLKNQFGGIPLSKTIPVEELKKIEES